MGLTIVERISHLLDHQVSLQSEPGKGTQFRVSVPRSEQHAAPTLTTRQPITSDSAPLLANRFVLIIENDEQISAAMTQLLEDWGATVSVSRSFEEAKDITPVPDLMLVDYHLDHGETGIQAASRLRELWQYDVPGILNTANRHDGVRDEAREAGLHYLPKPLKPAALKRLLKQHIC